MCIAKVLDIDWPRFARPEASWRVSYDNHALRPGVEEKSDVDEETAKIDSLAADFQWLSDRVAQLYRDAVEEAFRTIEDMREQGAPKEEIQRALEDIQTRRKQQIDEIHREAQERGGA